MPNDMKTRLPILVKHIFSRKIVANLTSHCIRTHLRTDIITVNLFFFHILASDVQFGV